MISKMLFQSVILEMENQILGKEYVHIRKLLTANIKGHLTWFSRGLKGWHRGEFPRMHLLLM